MKNITVKNSTLKNCLLATVITGALAATATVHAESVPLETAIAQAIAAQGQRVMNEVSNTLTTNIKQEINAFSIDAAWQWFNNETSQKAVVTNSKFDDKADSAIRQLENTKA